MKKLFILICGAFFSLSMEAQQLINSGFEEWNGATFNGEIQPTGWNYSNVTQFGFKFNFAHRVTGSHSGSYAAMVQDQEVGAAGITETSPGYFSLGQPWVYVESLTKINYATAGTYGGTNWTYRPDSMQVWIKRTGDNVLKEDFHLLYYAWSGTAKGDKYRGKNGNCTSVTYTDEESDVRLALDGNECGTTVQATQVAEGWWYEMKEYAEWTCINVPIYYMNDVVPSKCNVIFSASNYPNFRANSGLYAGNSLYVDDVKMVYSSQIQSLYIGGKKWNGFVPTMTEEQTYSLGETATSIPEIYAVRGEGTLVNKKGTVVNFPGRRLSGNEITIENGMVDGAPTIITVRAEDGSSTTVYKIKFVRAASTNSRLAGIQVNGNEIGNFNPYTFAYNYELPYGTTTVPEISVSKAEDAQNVEITQPSSINGAATITVTAADKKTVSTYVVNFSIAQLADNTLADIKIDGESLTGFLPTKNIYTVELPLGTTQVPVITPVSAYPQGEQTIVCANNGLDGTYTIAVTAPGNEMTRTYKLNFKITASSFTELADLSVAGYNINFIPSIKVYYVVLPMGTSEADIPAVNYVKGDRYQSISQSTETDEEGNVVVKTVVTAANMDQLTYKVMFEIPRSDNYYLNGISIDGSPLPGFNSNVNTYNVELPIGTTALPSVTFEKGDEFQTVTVSSSAIDVTDHTATTRITVTAGNGSAYVYVINYTVAQADNTTLTMIYVNGTAIDGFNSGNLTYNVTLPAGTTSWPSVTFDKHDEYQQVTARKGTFKASAANAYTLVVKSGSGTTASYVITFTVATASSNTDLAAIYLNGLLLDGFSAKTTSYTVTLPAGTTTAPSVTADKGEGAQTLTVNQASSPTGTATIKVTAADKKTTRTYSVKFALEVSTNAFLSSISVGGNPLGGFNQNQFEYDVLLPIGTTVLPSITYTRADNFQEVSVRNEVVGLTGDYRIIVTSQSGVTNTYTLHISVATSSNASLSMIYVNGTAVEGFDSNILLYNVSLPAGTTSVPNVTFERGDEYQTVSVNTGNLNEETEIVVQAADGKTIKRYVLTYTIRKSDNVDLSMIYVGGVAMDSFSPNNTSYTYNLSSSTTSLPEITFDKADDMQVVTVRTDGMTGLEGSYRLVVTAESGISRTYTIDFAVVISSNSSLSMIRLDGVELDGFIPTQKEYDIVLPVGTSVLPEITWTQGDEMQNVTLTENGVSGTATILVRAENKTTSSYLLNFSVEKASVTTINMIYVGGEAIPNFNPDSTEYNIDLKSSTTVLPEVTYDKHDIYQTVNLREDGMDGLEGDYRIVVTAQTGSSRVYTLHFSIVISRNANLQAIYLDGEPMGQFKESVLDYEVDLPIGTTDVPVITWLPGDEFQSITTNFRGLDGRNDIIVTAQDGTKRTYSVVFEVIQNTNSQLAMIRIDGVNIPDFHTDTLHYNVVLPQGTNQVPVISFEKNVETQVVSVVYGSLDTETRVIVRAENGNTTSYSLHFAVAVSSNNALENILIDSIALVGFRPDSTDYVVELPAGTIVLPDINPVSADEWQRVVVNYGSLNGISTVYVCAQDGSERLYRIRFVVGKSDNADLSMIYLDNQPLANFAPDVYDYSCTLAPGQTQVPAITFDRGTPCQSVVISTPSSVGVATIHVMAEDGTSVADYHLNFDATDTRSNVSTLSGINVAGEPLVGFAPDSFVYNYVLPAGTSVLPAIVPVKGQAAESVSITYGTVVDTTFIRVLAENRKTQSVYKVHFSVAPSQSALLSELRIDGTNVLVPGEFVYSYQLPADATHAPMIEAVRGDESQNVVVVTPDFTGDATILVKAVSGTTQTYIVHVTSALDDDTSLRDILVDGVSMTDFNPDVTSYDIDLPSGSVSLPEIQPVKNVESQTVSVYPMGVNGLTSIYVRSEKGSTRVYELAFRTPLEDVAMLSMIRLDGAPLADFDADVTEYVYYLDPSDTIAPVVTAETTTERQSVDIAQTKLTGMTTVTVWSEDFSVSRTYTIDFRHPMSTNATLAEIRLNGNLLPDFNPNVFTYSLPATTDMLEGEMDITYLSADSTQTVLLANSGRLGAQLIVRAENGTQNTYTITYTEQKSSYAHLVGLRIYDYDEGQYINIPDFHPDTLHYIYTLPRHATVTPSVYPIKSYDGQVVTVAYGQVGMTTTITVLAEDSVSSVVYTIDFASVRSDVNTLESVQIDFSDIDFDFHAEQNDYDILLPNGTDAVPPVYYTKADDDQLVTFVSKPIGDTTTISVTAENGSVRTYRLYFHAAMPTAANRLKAIHIVETDTDLDLSDNTQREFNVSLPYNSRTLSVEYEKAFPEQTVMVQPGGVYHPTIITVRSNRPGEVDEMYTLTPVMPENDPAVLTTISVNNAQISGFSPYRFSYIVNVASTPVIRYTANKGADVNVTIQTQKHWQAEVTFDGRTNVYDVWYFYENDSIPNNEFSDWSATTVYNGASKPVGWNVPADAVNSLNAVIWKYTSGAEVAQDGSGIAKLQTSYDGALGGMMPGLMTLGRITGSLGVAGSSTLNVAGGITFRNTPDQFLANYKQSAISTNNMIQLDFTGTDGSFSILHTDESTMSDFSTLTISLIDSMRNVGTPSQVNIILNSYKQVGPTIAANAATMYVDWVRFTYNSTLSALKVNGIDATLTDSEWTVTLTDPEITVLPNLAFTGVVPDQAQLINWSDEDDLGVRSATVRNFAEDGTFTDYTLSVQRPLDTRNYLADLLVGSASIAGFNASTTEYTYHMTSSQKQLPDILPVPASSLQTIAVSYADSLLTVVVTPESGSPKTYTVRFVTDLSNDVTLAAVSNLETFMPAVTSYQLATLTDMQFTKQMDGQTVEYIETASARTFNVTAEDGKKGTYTVSLIPVPVSGNGNLSEIRFDHDLLEGFSPAVTAYSYGSEIRSGIAFAKESPADSVVEIFADEYVEWNLISPDMSTRTYRVDYEQLTLSSDASLSMIYVNGTPLEGFNAALSAYTYKSESDAFLVSFERNHTAQRVNMTYTASTVTVQVIAEDGTTNVYTVNFSRQKNTDSHLAMIYLNGVPLDNFHPYVDSYNIVLPAPSTPKASEAMMPSITVLAGAPNQNLFIDNYGINNDVYIEVTAESGASSTYVLNISTAQATDPSLAALYVNGESLLREGRYEYKIVLDNDDDPQVAYLARTTEPYQTVELYQHSTLEEEDRIVVTAENGDQNTYYISYSVSPLYHSAELAAVTLDGVPMQDFRSDIYSYRLSLPYGTSAIPVIDAVLSRDDQQYDISVSDDNRSAIIRVTAPDGTTEQTYRFLFSAERSSNANLMGISVDYEPIAEFAPDVMAYNLTVEGTSFSVQYVRSEPAQQVLQVRDGALTKLIVIAEDGTTKVYTLDITTTVPASGNAYLEDILVNDVSVEGFDARKFSYTVSLPSNDAPVIRAVQAADNQTVEILTNDDEKTAILNVYSEDGLMSSTYTLSFNVKPSVVDTLAMIYADGMPLEGFAGSQTAYTLSLPVGTRRFPYISWMMGNLSQSVRVDTVSDSRYSRHLALIVTPQAGTSRAYTVTMDVTRSAVDTLSMIYLDDAPLADFNASRLNYDVVLPVGTSEYPDISYSVGDAYQNVDVSVASISANTAAYDVRVTAENGAVRTYRLNMSVALSSVTTLRNLLINGETLVESGRGYTSDADFDPERLTYHISWAIGTSVLPQISYTTEDNYQTVNFKHMMTSLDDSVLIHVAAENGAYMDYVIYSSLLHSYVDTLRMIYVGNVPLEGFDAQQDSFVVTLPVGTRVLPEFETVKGNSYQSVSTSLVSMSAYETVYRIIVTAEAGNIRQYTLIFTTDKSQVASLRALRVNGENIAAKGIGYSSDADFDPARTAYHITWAVGTTAMPVLDYIPGDDYQSVRWIHTMNSLNDSAALMVTAENGTQTTYVLYSTLDHSYADTLRMIYVNNMPIENFDAQRDSFIVQLEVGTRTLPEFEAVKGDPFQSVTTRLVAQSMYETAYKILVTAEAGNTREYTLVFTTAKSSVATLRNIRVNGLSLNTEALGYTCNAAFEPEVFKYHLVWNIGTSVLPDVEAVAGDKYQNVSFLNTMRSLGDSLCIAVTAEDGTNNTYVLYNTLAHSSVDTLRMIYANGLDLAGFNARLDSFVVNLPVGTTSFPTLEVMKAEQWQTVTIQIVSSTDYARTVRISVIAEDGISERVYTVIFNILRSDVASLAYLTVNGFDFNATEQAGFTSDADFNPDIYTYHLTWNVGTSDAPRFEYAALDQRATVAVLHQPYTPSDSLVLRVYAENGSFLTYRVFNAVMHSAVDTLAMLYVDHLPYEDFKPYQTTFNISLPVGTRSFPELDFDPGDDFQRISLDTLSVTDYEADYRIIVAAEDGRHTRIYNVRFSVLRSDKDYLEGIYVDNHLINGFRRDSFYYTYTLPVDADTLPLITYDAADRYQTITLIRGNVDGESYITVEAENGTTRMYTLYFPILRSSNAYLDGISVAGTPLANFDKEQLTYRVALPYGTLSMPVVTYTLSEEEQKANISYDYSDWTVTISVLAANGTTKATYVLAFSVLRSDNASLRMIYTGNEQLAGFSPDLYEYHVDLPHGTQNMPAVEYLVADSQQVVSVTLDTISWTATLNVRSGSGDFINEYIIYFSVLLSDENRLADLRIKGTTIYEFNPDIYEYTVLYPALTDSAELASELDIEAVPMDPDAMVDILQITPELITVTVTSQSGIGLVYSVRQQILLPGNSLLDTLALDNELLNGFDPLVTYYEYILPRGTQTMPAVYAVPQDELADVSVTVGVVDSVPTKIYCTAQNGQETVYEIYFRTAPYSEAQSARAHDVIFRHIAGTNTYLAATIRLDVQVAVYDAAGHLVYYGDVAPCNPNDATVTLDLDGVEHLTEVTDIDSGVVIQLEPNRVYTYAFFEGGKRRIASGHVMMTY